MVIGTHASGALVLATAHQAQDAEERSRARGACVVARVWYLGVWRSREWRDSAKWCLFLGYGCHLQAEIGTFTVLARSLRSFVVRAVTFFYVKRAELLHYPHPMIIPPPYVVCTSFG